MSVGHSHAKAGAIQDGLKFCLAWKQALVDTGTEKPAKLRMAFSDPSSIIRWEMSTDAN